MPQTASLLERAKLLLKRVPGVRSNRTLNIVYHLLKTDSFRFVSEYPPGSYHSPIPDFKETLTRQRILFEPSVGACPGIDLREEAQLELLETFSRYYNDLPFSVTPSEATRYYYQNSWFSYGDTITLYSVLRHHEPSKIIEIGSGFSSAAMLDVNDLFLSSRVHFTFVEPDPTRLFDLLKREDKSKYAVVQKQVQDVPLEVF